MLLVGVAVRVLELRGLLRALGGVALGVRVRTHTRELAVVDNQVLVADGLLVEVALQDLTHTSGVPRLFSPQVTSRGGMRHATSCSPLKSRHVVAG